MKRIIYLFVFLFLSSFVYSENITFRLNELSDPNDYYMNSSSTIQHLGVAQSFPDISEINSFFTGFNDSNILGIGGYTLCLNTCSRGTILSGGLGISDQQYYINDTITSSSVGIDSNEQFIKNYVYYQNMQFSGFTGTPALVLDISLSKNYWVHNGTNASKLILNTHSFYQQSGYTFAIEYGLQNTFYKQSSIGAGGTSNPLIYTFTENRTINRVRFLVYSPTFQGTNSVIFLNLTLSDATDLESDANDTELGNPLPTCNIKTQYFGCLNESFHNVSFTPDIDCNDSENNVFYSLQSMSTYTSETRISFNEESCGLIACANNPISTYKRYVFYTSANSCEIADPSSAYVSGSENYFIRDTYDWEQECKILDIFGLQIKLFCELQRNDLSSSYKLVLDTETCTQENKNVYFSVGNNSLANYYFSTSLDNQIGTLNVTLFDTFLSPIAKVRLFTNQSGTYLYDVLNNTFLMNATFFSKFELLFYKNTYNNATNIALAGTRSGSDLFVGNATIYSIPAKTIKYVGYEPNGSVELIGFTINGVYDSYDFTIDKPTYRNFTFSDYGRYQKRLYVSDSVHIPDEYDYYDLYFNVQRPEYCQSDELKNITDILIIDASKDYFDTLDLNDKKEDFIYFAYFFALIGFSVMFFKSSGTPKIVISSFLAGAMCFLFAIFTGSFVPSVTFAILTAISTTFLLLTGGNY